MLLWDCCDTFKCLTDDFNWMKKSKFVESVSLSHISAYVLWIKFQVILYCVIPGSLNFGDLTPSGKKYPYIINGGSIYLISIGTLIVLDYGLKVVKITSIAKSLAAHLASINIATFLSAGLIYLKAISTNLNGECIYRNSFIDDLYQGIELNPRIGQYFDLKIYLKRVEKISISIANLSILLLQYEQLGYVTNAMVLSNILLHVDIGDYFICEVTK
jgi:7-dehydrocholesterol reductase